MPCFFNNSLDAMLFINSNKMCETKTFKRNGIDFDIFYFDNDKEIEFCISKDCNGEAFSTWLSPNQVNELITHLAKCLSSIKEPVELLNIK